MSRWGIVVALSGVDCSGKSTQRDLLLAALRERGFSPINIYSRPGYSAGLRFARKTLRRLGTHKQAVRKGVSKQPGGYPRRASTLTNPLRRWLWLTLGLLDLLWLYCLWMRWLRFRGRAVLCNRYLLDALVDLRVNFPEDRVERRWLWRLLRRCSPRPDAWFCLLVPVEETMARSRGKVRYHWETQEVLQARLREYEALGDAFGAQTLDGRQPVEELRASIQRSLALLLPQGELGPGTHTSLNHP